MAGNLSADQLAALGANLPLHENKVAHFGMVAGSGAGVRPGMGMEPTTLPRTGRSPGQAGRTQRGT